jgi:hypothetical protein
MKKQTAVEFLGHELNVKLFYDISPELWEQVNEIFKQAKAMEKEQMIDFAFNCQEMFKHQIEEEYNQTHGGDK